MGIRQACDSDIVSLRKKIAQRAGEDVAQDLLLKVLEREEENWEGWCTARVRQSLYNTRRHYWKEAELEVSLVASRLAPDPADIAEAREQIKAVGLAILLLAVEQKGISDRVALSRFRSSSKREVA